MTARLKSCFFLCTAYIHLVVFHLPPSDRSFQPNGCAVILRSKFAKKPFAALFATKRQQHGTATERPHPRPPPVLPLLPQQATTWHQRLTTTQRWERHRELTTTTPNKNNNRTVRL